MADVLRQVADINKRVAALGVKHDRALAKATQCAPRAGVPMNWLQQRKFEKYRKASLKLLAEVLMSANELSTMVDLVLDTQQVTEAERAQVKDALLPEWARRLTKQQTKKEEQT